MNVHRPWLAHWSWITREEDHTVSAVWAIASPEVPKGRLRLRISASHHYRLWRNTQMVGRGPDRADARFLYADEYLLSHEGGPFDLTALVYHFRAGKGSQTRNWCLAGGPPGLIAEICCEDGQTIPIAWKMKRSAAWNPDAPEFSRFRGPMQDVDAAVLMAENNAMTSGWAEAHEFAFGHSGFYPVPLPRENPPLRSESVRPSHVTRLASASSVISAHRALCGYMPEETLTIRGGMVIFDFALPFCGFPVLEFEGDGAVEVLFGEGRFLMRQDRVRLAGGRMRYEGMDWRGGNRLALDCSGVTGELKVHRIEIDDRVYPFAGRGTFDCDRAEWNRLWEVCRETVYRGVRDHPVDCCFREQALWIEDMAVHCRAARACFGDTAPFCKALLQVLRVMYEDGSLPVPGPAGIGYDRENAHWSTMGLLVPVLLHELAMWQPEMIRGNPLFLDRMKKLISYYESYETGEGLLSVESPGRPSLWKFFGWNPSLRSGTPADLNAAYVIALQKLSEIARLADDKAMSEFWLTKSKRLGERVIERFWMAERGLFCNGEQNGNRVEAVSPTVNGWCALAGLIPESGIGQWAHAMDGDPGLLPPVTPYDASVMMMGFAKCRLDSHVRRMLDGYFGSIVRTGRRTLPEYWQEQNQGIGGLGDDSSDCHPFGTSPAFVFHEWVLGVVPETAGWDNIRIVPNALGLWRASGCVPSPKGNIRVEWERTDTRWILDVELPQGIRANVRLPRLGCGPQRLLRDGETCIRTESWAVYQKMAQQDPIARLEEHPECSISPGFHRIVTETGG